jgi:rhamnogalacturonan acetylesterase
MAKGGGGSGTEGWGQYLKYSFNTANYAVENDAIAGRSARSYTREGRFQTVANSLKVSMTAISALLQNIEY